MAIGPLMSQPHVKYQFIRRDVEFLKIDNSIVKECLYNGAHNSKTVIG